MRIQTPNQNQANSKLTKFIISNKDKNLFPYFKIQKKIKRNKNIKINTIRYSTPYILPIFGI